MSSRYHFAESKLESRIRQLLEAGLLALCKLNRIQFEAPWRPGRTGC